MTPKAFTQARHTLQQCYLRGAQMVKEVAQRMPVLTAITVCVDVKDKPVVQPKEDKPKKPVHLDKSGPNI